MAQSLGQMDAFKQFWAGVKERCDEPPRPVDVNLGGAYGLFRG